MYLKKLQNELFPTYKRIRNFFLIKLLLRTISVIYLVLYKLRALFYRIGILKTYKLPIKVISIGNLTCGGTGKTPLTIELAKYLTKTGLTVAVLSRGYKRKFDKRENVLVRDTEDLLAEYEQSGDEAYLMAKKLTKSIVLSGRDRIKASNSACKLGADIAIIDDGYQYLKLHRDKNILIIDGKNPFDNGLLLPAGELRELPESIQRATSVVLSNPTDPEIKSSLINEINKYSTNIPVIEMYYSVKKLRGINLIKNIDINQLNNKTVVAFSGIGNPKSFEENLTANGLTILKHFIYDDHHDYELTEISNLIDFALSNNVEDIITTEKDTVKIENMCEGAPVTFWETSLEVNWNIENPFEQLI